MTKTKPVFGQLALFPPDTNWTVAKELPDWRRRPIVAIDTEVKDLGLSNDLGAGWALPDHGHIVGVSMAVSETEKIYAPIRHPDSDNFAVDRVIRWVSAHLAAPCRKVFHNSIFDLGWFGTDFRIDMDSKLLEDTMALAVILDENRLSYSLDNLCKDEGLPAKNEKKLREAAATFGVDPKKELWKLPAKYVGEYAEQDAASTLGLFNRLYPQLESMQDAYRLEIDLIPLVILMRRRGIRIDLGKAEEAQTKFTGMRDTYLERIKEILGLRRPVTVENIHSPGWLAYAFDEQGLSYPRTPKTKQGQFKAEWLEKQPHDLPRLIVDARTYHDAADKFIGKYIRDYTFNERVHSEIHHIRSDDGGTRSYRFSYSDPPLQQIPAEGEIGLAIRSIFLPEKGEQWGAYDLKGQEPALTVHTAASYGCIGSKEAVHYYNTDPNPDYHNYVAFITGIPRTRAKIINLSLAYGMGLEELCRRLNVDLETGTAILKLYHAKMPFIAQLTKMLTYEANTNGFVILLDGARCRFNFWEPQGHKYNTQAPAPSLEVAQKRWPGQPLRRFGTRKAMNRKIQGGSARQIKLIMRECYNQKLYPLLQVHDELDFSLSGDTTEKITRIMCDTVKLKVPTRVDLVIGDSW